MTLLEELLEPIEEGTPVGPYLRGSDEYAEIERTFQAADEPPEISPTGVPSEPAAEFEDVVPLCEEFLQTQC